MKKITDFKEFINITNNDDVFVKIGSECCGPCELLEERITSLENDYPNIEFIKLDVDDMDSDLEKYVYDNIKVETIPHSLRIKNGLIVIELVGVLTEDKLRVILNDK